MYQAQGSPHLCQCEELQEVPPFTESLSQNRPSVTAHGMSNATGNASYEEPSVSRGRPNMPLGYPAGQSPDNSPVLSGAAWLRR
jgi:hypothetical protein